MTAEAALAAWCDRVVREVELPPFVVYWVLDDVARATQAALDKGLTYEDMDDFAWSPCHTVHTWRHQRRVA